MLALDSDDPRQDRVFELGGKALPLDPALMRRIAADTDHGRLLDNRPERIAVVIQTFVDEADAAHGEQARVLLAKLHIVCHAAAVCGVTRHPPAGTAPLNPFEPGSRRVH